MVPRSRGRNPASRRPREHSNAHQEGFGHLLHRLAFLTDGDGESRQSDGAAAEPPAERVENRPLPAVAT